MRHQIDVSFAPHRLWMSDGKIFFLKFYLNFLMFHKKRGAFYICVKVKFSLHIFVIILEMILMSENQAKNLLKTSK